MASLNTDRRIIENLWEELLPKCLSYLPPSAWAPWLLREPASPDGSARPCPWQSQSRRVMRLHRSLPFKSWTLLLTLKLYWIADHDRACVSVYMCVWVWGRHGARELTWGINASNFWRAISARRLKHVFCPRGFHHFSIRIKSPGDAPQVLEGISFSVYLNNIDMT